MKHLGDITKINGAEIEAVDVITGGSPCQDLSIAGKRAGLAGARSGLFMEQIRIVKEMRAHDKANGRTGDMVRPRFMVWENVPGAFSSNKGQDFAAVLEEIIRIAEPEAPDIEVPEKGWNTWGGYHDEVGGRWSVAWRVHDAQHWGVPQRRRRISVVADFGGDTAGEILFERKSVSRHFAESGTARERLAGNTKSGASYAVRIRGGCDGGGKGALVQEDKSGTLGTSNDQTIFQNCLTQWDCQSKRIFGTEGASPTLQGGVGGGVNNPAIFCMGTQQGGAEVRSDDRAPTLTASAGMSGNNQPVVCAGFKLGNSEKARSIGYAEEQSPTLNAECGGNQVPLTYQMQGFGDYREGDVASSCKQRDFKDGTDLVCSVDCRNFCEGGETNGTLQAKSNGGISYNLQNTVRTGMVVRRLTPMECERLQGYPDGWTDIGEWYDGQTGEGYWVDSLGKRHKTADSPRYKALGNSIALPFWDFLAKRISAQYLRPVTMGSLFDGIGGFPLVFERHNGKGTARWASEIEEFPIVVTKLRFGEE
jgi:DNA (cytosine-5)-methyltransferase 1